MIQFDTEPKQIMLGNLQTGLQIVATINMEDLIDGVMLGGHDSTAMLLGSQLIELLNVDGRLTTAIDPQKHIADLIRHVHGELDQKDYDKDEKKSGNSSEAQSD